MNYDFNQIINRRGSGCHKWDLAPEGVIPMYIADMDFRVAQPIIDAMQQRLNHGIFGYTHLTDDYYNAVINWFKRRHNWSIRREWIQYTMGVVPAISAIIKAFTLPGDNVLIQTPVYNCFFSSIRNNGCQAVDAPLTYADNTYTIDYKRLEQLASDPRTRLMLLCNPHNPAGRVWTEAELRHVGEICLRHHVIVVADEIHCELTMPGYKYVPFMSLGGEIARNTIVCNSASKSFNIAGLQISNIICQRPEWQERIDRAININETCDVNPFGIVALMAAYNHCADWIEQLDAYICDNYHALCRFLREQLPELSVCKMEGTYLPWINIQALNIGSEELCERLKNEHGVWLNPGTMYGTEGFIRVNIACPRSTMMEGMRRMADGIRAIAY